MARGGDEADLTDARGGAYGNPQRDHRHHGGQVAGRAIAEEIDIVAAECVFGMNMFRDLFASIRDAFGGRKTLWRPSG